MTDSVREALPYVREWSRGPPDVLEWSGGPPGSPGVGRRPSRMSGSGPKAVPDVREARPDVRKFGSPSRRSGSGRNPSRMSGSVRVALPYVR